MLKRTLTLQERRQLINPVLVAAGVAAPVPDDAAGDLWRHGPEAQARVGADDGAVELPLGLARVQQLQEGPHADSHEHRQRRVEREVEDEDFVCKGTSNNPISIVGVEAITRNFFGVEQTRGVVFTGRT